MFFYHVKRKVHRKILKPAMLEHTHMNKRDIKENQKLGSLVNKSVHRPEPAVLGPESSVQHLRLESRNSGIPSTSPR